MRCLSDPQDKDRLSFEVCSDILADRRNVMS